MNLVVLLFLFLVWSIFILFTNFNDKQKYVFLFYFILFFIIAIHDKVVLKN